MLIARRFVPTVAATALALLLILGAGVACSSGDGDNGDGGSPTDTTPVDGDNGGDDGGGGEEISVDISMIDNLFEPSEATVGPGDTVTFNLTNDGAAIHNMRVAGEDNSFDTEDDVLSDPELVSPGEAAALVWEAPAAAGVYDFRCDFHPTDMFGTITVE